MGAPCCCCCLLLPLLLHVIIILTLAGRRGLLGHGGWRSCCCAARCAPRCTAPKVPNVVWHDKPCLAAGGCGARVRVRGRGRGQRRRLALNHWGQGGPIGHGAGQGAEAALEARAGVRRRGGLCGLRQGLRGRLLLLLGQGELLHWLRLGQGLLLGRWRGRNGGHGRASSHLPAQQCGRQGKGQVLNGNPRADGGGAIGGPGPCIHLYKLGLRRVNAPGSVQHAANGGGVACGARCGWGGGCSVVRL